MNYCAGYIRQQENQQLGIPRRDRPALLPAGSRSSSATVYNGLIGHIDKQHPAKVVLAGDEGVDMVWDLLRI